MVKGLGTATRRPSHRRATMAVVVLSSPATLIGFNEKKTGPSRFRPDFLTDQRDAGPNFSEVRMEWAKFLHFYCFMTVTFNELDTSLYASFSSGVSRKKR
jgi:hypothetical protein